ncbi:MAG: hypothetical protein IJ105_03870 [Bacilli bacterium]|nr:hypothetical protein [Bacilli bacterium]
MKEKKQLYWVKLALDGNTYDTVKIQAENLNNIPKKHKILEYKPIKK